MVVLSVFWWKKSIGSLGIKLYVSWISWIFLGEIESFLTSYAASNLDLSHQFKNKFPLPYMCHRLVLNPSASRLNTSSRLCYKKVHQNTDANEWWIIFQNSALNSTSKISICEASKALRGSTRSTHPKASPPALQGRAHLCNLSAHWRWHSWHRAHEADSSTYMDQISN